MPPTSPPSSTRRFTAILISGALASKVLGFGREILMANVLGASLVADGFRGAITAVMLPLAFLQNESVPAIMIPMHRDAMKAGNAPQRLGALTVAVTSVAIVLMTGIQLLGENWVHAFVGGFTAEGRLLTLDFVRIMALGMPASAMINVLAAGEIALGRTRLTNVRASILNIAVLIGIALLSVSGNFLVLGWSFAIAFNVLGAWGLFTMWREGVLSFRGLTLGAVISAGREFLRRLRPLLALPVAEQANVWAERLLASRVATGAVASLDYARTLTESALLLISQPVGLAVLSSHPPKDPAAQVESIARPILALALPASAFLVMFAPDIVRLVFFRGAFNEHAVTLTSQALRGIAFGLWASTLAWILIRILNGAGRNFAAAVIIVTAYVVNIAVNFLTLQILGGDNGTLLLGIGESTRGLVLLAGVVIALDSRLKLLRLIMLASLPAALMVLLGWQIHERIADTLPRLFAGGGAYLACSVLAAAMLMPALRVAVFSRVVGRLRRMPSVPDGKRLRILSIAHPAMTADGGRLRYDEMVKRDDVEVHLVVPAVWYQFGRTLHADPALDPRLKLHILPIALPRAGPMSWYLHFYPGLRRLIREIDPDVIHLWEEPWSIVALQARFLKGRAAMVMEVDQNILKRLPPPFEWIRKQVLRHTAHVLSRSPDATAVVLARGYKGPVTPIGYGVDLANFSPDGAPLMPRAMRPDFRIGYVGRLVEEKGLDDALDAMKIATVPVSLAIMGEGPHEARLRRRIDELGLADRVTIRGWGTPADVAAFLRSLDVTILLTRTTRSVREQFGRVIVESQACGIPVIGSQGGAIPDVVGDGGWIVPERDPAALAQLLESIAADPQALRAHGLAAQSNVSDRFTYRAVADDLVSACRAAAKP